MTSEAADAEPNQDMNMAELLDSVEDIKPLRRGDIVEGMVMRSDPDGILVNIGHKAEGIVPPRETRTLGDDAHRNIQVGDQIVAYVIRPESGESAAILSIDRAVGERGWKTLEKLLEAAETVEGAILGFNRGGAIVEVEGVQGFVPMSQLVSVPRDVFSTPRQEEATDALADGEAPADGEPEPQAEESQESTGPSSDDFVGDVLKLKVLEVNRPRNRAIFSERQAVRERREAEKAKLIEELQVGEVRTGKVTGVSNFGAFVDLGGADGLVHISEMSWDNIRSPSDLVKMGDEVKVYVLKVDAENRKIALSLRRLEPEPWDTIHERFHVDDVVDGVVTKLTNFGAFARIEGSVEGLIHISELANRRIAHPRDVVQEGDEVKLKILRIEPERRRMGLSLRQAEDDPYAGLYG